MESVDPTQAPWIPARCRLLICQQGRMSNRVIENRRRIVEILAKPEALPRKIYATNTFYFNTDDRLVVWHKAIFNQPVVQNVGWRNKQKELGEALTFINIDGDWQPLEEKNDYCRDVEIIGSDGYMEKVIVRVISNENQRLTLKHYLSLTSPWLKGGG